MSFYTLTYSESAQGWPSFYSYMPEFMIGMNQHFYSFSEGNLWIHNKGQRARFYAEGVSANIVGVFNEEPTETKLFKTLELQGNEKWTAKLNSDIEATGFIDSNYDDFWEKKEGAWYGYIRNDEDQAPPWNRGAVTQYPLNSTQGIGTSIANSLGVIDFPLDFRIPSNLSVGDVIFNGSVNPPEILGVVTSIEVDIPNGINRINHSQIPIGHPPDATYFFFMKNAISESNGIVGHYMIFDLTYELFPLENDIVELYAVQTELMKSFP